MHFSTHRARKYVYNLQKQRDRRLRMPSSVKAGKVRLLPGIFREREQVNREYLMSLKNRNLLQNFYLEAGIPLESAGIIGSPAESDMHFGWESTSCQLRGHFLGHWMSAAAMSVAVYGDMELKAKLDLIVDGLALCQEMNGGKWAGSIPEKYFRMLEGTKYVWSPQYTMHKTMMGLFHAWIYAGNTKAAEILGRQADWYTEWVAQEKERCPEAIYRGEQGGMLEIWAALYGKTGEKKYLDLAEAYSGEWTFSELAADRDCLTNTHCNASVPLAHGACRMYEVTGERKWLDTALAFWKKAVTERGHFCTGGSNAGEFWIPPEMFGNFLSDRDQEFCTVYNLVRLADYLFRLTGDSSYGDYIELNLYNGFLAQQNRHTGTPAYFLPLAAGSRKKWGTRTNDFWCCHGTMVQAQTLYPSVIWHEDGDDIIVSQYIPSVYTDGEFRVEQTVDMKFYDTQSFFEQTERSQTSRWQMKFTVRSGDGEKRRLRLRIPAWTGKPEVTLNGHPAVVSCGCGFMTAGPLGDGDELRITFVPEIRAVELPGDSSMYAFMEGPVVLAGLTDGDTPLSFDARNPAGMLKPQCEHIYSSFSWKQSTYTTRNQQRNFTFIPLYEITDERYTVYFQRK